jgi:predicted helicase
MLRKFQESYGREPATVSPITKADILYYVYGILHSRSYRERFAADLKKQLPRIPMVDDFRTFSQAGRKLAALHLNYETLEPYPLVERRGMRDVGREEENSSHVPSPSSLYHVSQMKFPSKTDKSKIIYNAHLTLEGIPPETYRYIVNGKSALEWIMERYAVTTHKDSGIENDPNDWCKEQGNERYIVDLVKRIVALSVESVRIIEGLPELAF